MQDCDGASDLHEIEGKERVDVGGTENTIVAVAVEVVIVGVAGHVVAAGAGVIDAVLLGIERGPTRIGCKLADVANAKVTRACVVVAVATVVAVAGNLRLL